jgi:hypothetical protein
MSGQRQLVFIRAKTRFTDQIQESHPVFKSINAGEMPVMRTPDTLVIPFTVPRENRSNYIGRFQSDKVMQEWAAFVEVVEIGLDIASAPPILKPDHHANSVDIYEECYDIPPTEYRKSTWLSSILSSTPATGFPHLGRKMLIMTMDENLDDKEIERITDKVKKVLGVQSKGVWHGRGLLGLCFATSRSSSKIMEKLNYLFDRQELKDCLLVQPIEVVVPNESGLSPLAEWVAHGFLGDVGNVSVLNQKAKNSSKTIKVELRRPHRIRKGS